MSVRHGEDRSIRVKGLETTAQPVHIPAMSTMVEIQQAIEKLADRDKKALAAWLSSTGDTWMSEPEEAALLASLDKAARQLDAGQGVAIDEVRSMVPQWAAR